MKKLFIFLFSIILLSACSLDVANVVGPAGGYIFWDKRNYSGGWRYIECCPISAGTVNFDKEISVIEAKAKLASFSYNSFNDWELPDDDELLQMLKSFRWELTRFENHHLFLSSSGSVYSNNYDKNWFADQEKVENVKGNVNIRPIRRF